MVDKTQNLPTQRRRFHELSAATPDQRQGACRVGAGGIGAQLQALRRGACRGRVRRRVLERRYQRCETGACAISRRAGTLRAGAKAFKRAGRR